jgi:hypothetical protein
MSNGRKLHAALALLTTTLVSAGCSSGGSELVSSQSIASVESNLVTTADIRRTPPDSAERAFLRFWAYVQYRGWSAALADYEPALVSSVGATNIIEGLKTQSSYFERVKPLLKGTVRLGNQAVVRYIIPDAAGNPMPTSISWRRVGNAWRIHYDPQLDGMLQAAEMARVQMAVDPNAPKPSKAALKAGADAARLQSFYLQSQSQQSPKP